MDKNQFARYKEYDAIFRNFKEEWSKADIITELAISERTFNLDRTAMQELFDVEIKSLRGNEKNYIYRYADKDMSISEKPLTQEEVDRVEQAVAILSGVSGLELFEGFEHILSNLRGFASKSKIMDEMEPFVSFQTDNWSNTKNFDVLFNAIRDEQVLEIIYKDFKSEEYTFELHPYFLKHYNEMWYLLGYNKIEHAYNWVSPLDRIQDIRFLNVNYKKNEAFNFTDDYFNDIVGVTRDFNQKVEEIKIKVEPNAVGFIDSKPLNRFQRPVKREEDGHYYTYLKVRPNRELYNRLLMFGNSIEVMEPKEVRQRLKGMVDGICLKYK
ncbi:WYL domain-containing protein [Bacteroidia bacterium]|nr:WYL domain-containing protein [Bacteroidia bacterium]